jgi:hypothetical protein
LVSLPVLLADSRGDEHSDFGTGTPEDGGRRNITLRYHKEKSTMMTERPGGSLPGDDREETDRPGGEVDKAHREVINHLVDNQGWRYKKPRRGGYPRLFPADAANGPIRVPMTGHTRGHAFDNWLAEIRRKGGHWLPGRK